MKVVINKRYGGFGLSYEGVMEYARRKGIAVYAFVDHGYYKNPEPWDGTGDAPFVAYWRTAPEWSDGNENRWSDQDIDRDDPALTATVEALGERANSQYAHLAVIEIPDDVEWTIEEYDGMEWVAEKHRTWD